MPEQKYLLPSLLRQDNNDFLMRFFLELDSLVSGNLQTSELLQSLTAVITERMKIKYKYSNLCLCVLVIETTATSSTPSTTMQDVTIKTFTSISQRLNVQPMTSISTT